MSIPLKIKDIHNITLQASNVESNHGSPILVAQFPCQYRPRNKSCIHIRKILYSVPDQIEVCCAVIHLINVTNSTFSDITIAVRSLNVSGVVVQQCSDILIQLFKVEGHSDVQSYKTHEVGILTYASTSVVINSSQVINISYGVILFNTSSSCITDTATMNCHVSGIELIVTNASSIINTISSNNSDHGVVLQSTNNVNLSNITAAYNFEGLLLFGCESTSMTNLYAAYNLYGMLLFQCNDTSMINITATHHQQYGILLRWCNSTSMNTILVVYNQNFGIELDQCNDTSMINIATAHNQYSGAAISSCANTTIKDVLAAYNEQNGIVMMQCADTKMINISTSQNQQSGLMLNQCKYTSMTNISLAYNQIGITLQQCDNTSMTNISAAHHKYGIILVQCNHTRMINISAAYHKHFGIMLLRCKDTSMIAIFVVHNQNCGIQLEMCNATDMSNISVANSQRLGIFLLNCANTSMKDVSVAYSTQNGIFLEQCTDTRMVNISVAYNGNRGLSLMNCTASTILKDSIFLNISSLQTPSDSNTNPSSLPAVITLYNSCLIIENCNFTRNSLTYVNVLDSTISVFGKVIFSNNSALSGIAFIFERKSKLIISDDSYIIFRNNHASSYGGAIHVHSEEMQDTSISLQGILEGSFNSPVIISKTECFVHIEGNRLDTSLVFMNNTAGKGGDVLYGGLLALGYDEDWNCLLGFKNVSDMSQQSGLSVISSDPSRVCLCNTTGEPDCLTVADPTTRVIYPGQTITIHAVVVGQDFGTVSGSVFAHLLSVPYTTGSVDMEKEQIIKTVEQTQCSSLEYTIFSQSERSDAVLVLTTDNLKADILQLPDIENNREIANTWTILNSEPNYTKLALKYILDFIGERDYSLYYTDAYYWSRTAANRTIENFYKFTPGYIGNLSPDAIHNKFIFPNEIYNYPLYINISFRSCPPGFTLRRQVPFKCDCNQLLQQFPGVKCHIQHQTITRRSLVWVGMSGNDTVAATEYCPLNYCNGEEMNVTLNNSDTQCNYNHSGTLCGGCQAGLSLALGSAQCLSCSNSYLSLLLAFAVAGFALVFVIKMLDLTVSHGTMNGLIFYANIIKPNEYIFYTRRHPNPLTVFIAWLNLDIGVETCFFNGLTAYGKTWLQFVFPLYIWSIAGLIIILAKYSNRVAMIMGNNSVPALATLFLLSYAKLYRNIITVLSYTILHTTHGQKAVWSADGNLDYLGPEHAPLFAMAIATLLFLWLPYTLLLFLGQWLHKFNCLLITRMLMKMKPFLDAYYAPFKDKHRYWFGALLLVRAAVLLTSAVVPANNSRIVVFSIALSAVLLPLWGQNVYRNSTIRMFDMWYFVNLALLAVIKLFNNDENISEAPYNILIGIAFAQFLGLILYKVFLIIKHSEKVKACLHQRERDDDWEPYEQAALLRENEPDSEEDQESDGSGSDVSLQTYGI